jgi:hypothetical protein
MTAAISRPDVLQFHNGAKRPSPLSQSEYARRLSRLREVMAARGITASLFTSMHNIAYYSGFFVLQLWSAIRLHSNARSVCDGVSEY